MVGEGADILDVGGESSRPGSDPVGEVEELGRILPVIEAVKGAVRVPISVDTFHSDVARRALAAGAAVVNDISGFKADPAMAALVAETGALAVVMHMRGTPKDMQADTHYTDLVGEVWQGLRESLDIAAAAGVPRERLMVDPGIGFGKSAEANLVLLRRLQEFSSLGCAVVVGASRKSFIGRILGIEDAKDRLEGSLAAATLAVWNGAHIVRAHDVRATRRAVDLAWAARLAGEE
jgi:dihydropteroate synthase